MRGQSRKRDIQKKSLKKQKQFIDRALANRSKKLFGLKKNKPLVFQVLAIFFGFDGYGYWHDCQRVAEFLNSTQGLELTGPQVHEIKWYGLGLSGWRLVEQHHYDKAENILQDIAEQKQEGDKKMTNQELFDKIKDDFSMVTLERRNELIAHLNEVQDLVKKGKPIFNAPLCLDEVALVFLGEFPRGFTDIVKEIHIAEETALLNLSVIFCFAFPERISETKKEIRELYLQIKGAYEKAQEQEQKPTSPEALEEGKKNLPIYYELVPLKSRREIGQLVLERDNEERSLGEELRVILVKEDYQEKRFSVIPLPSLDSNDEDLKRISDYMAGAEIILFLRQVKNEIDKREVYCLFVE